MPVDGGPPKQEVRAVRVWAFEKRVWPEYFEVFRLCQSGHSGGDSRLLTLLHGIHQGSWLFRGPLSQSHSDQPCPEAAQAERGWRAPTAVQRFCTGRLQYSSLHFQAPIAIVRSPAAGF